MPAKNLSVTCRKGTVVKFFPHKSCGFVEDTEKNQRFYFHLDKHRRVRPPIKEGGGLQFDRTPPEVLPWIGAEIVFWPKNGETREGMEQRVDDWAYLSAWEEAHAGGRAKQKLSRE